MANGVVIWIVVSYLFFIFKLIGKGTATVFLLVLPCTVLAISSELQELQFQFIASALEVQDCSSNYDKAHVQQAWEVAKKTSVQCDKYLKNVTGASAKELAKVRRFENCPGYDEALVTYKKEWTYLQQLEHTYQCGGWCVPDYPLWETSKTPLDSCALAAGHSMGSSIKHMGSQVAVFSFIVMISVTTFLILAPNWLKEQ